MFLSDEIPPNAVLIEYIPGVREIDLSNFSEERIVKLRRILDSMHRAKVEHGDPFPRNMMIQAGKYERVLWIDFDRANTFPEDVALTPRQNKWVAEEAEIMNYFAYALVGIRISCSLTPRLMIHADPGLQGREAEAGLLLLL
jgi:hypothetical protein